MSAMAAVPNIDKETGVYFERDKHGLLRRKHIIEIAEATLEV